MATKKVSLTLEASAVRRAQEVAGPRGLSAYVDVALGEKLERDARRAAMLEHLDQLDAVDPPDAAEVRRASRRSQAIDAWAAG